jgi:hypothetical protein
MATEQWLAGWKEIGEYIKESPKTAQRYARDGMPFLRDAGGRPMAKPSMIDDYIVELNQDMHDDKVWRDKGIESALGLEADKERRRKELDERIIAAQRLPRGRY